MPAINWNSMDEEAVNRRRTSVKAASSWRLPVVMCLLER